MAKPGSKHVPSGSRVSPYNQVPVFAGRLHYLKRNFMNEKWEDFRKYLQISFSKNVGGLKS